MSYSISISNNTISRAIWCEYAQISFPKTAKFLHKLEGQVQFCGL